MCEATMSRCAGTLVLCANVLWSACAIASADLIEARRTTVYETASNTELGGANRKPRKSANTTETTRIFDGYANVRNG